MLGGSQGLRDTHLHTPLCDAHDRPTYCESLTIGDQDGLPDLDASHHGSMMGLGPRDLHEVADGQRLVIRRGRAQICDEAGVTHPPKASRSRENTFLPPEEECTDTAGLVSSRISASRCSSSSCS